MQNLLIFILIYFFDWLENVLKCIVMMFLFSKYTKLNVFLTCVSMFKTTIKLN